VTPQQLARSPQPYQTRSGSEFGGNMCSLKQLNVQFLYT